MLQVAEVNVAEWEEIPARCRSFLAGTGEWAVSGEGEECIFGDNIIVAESEWMLALSAAGVQGKVIRPAAFNASYAGDYNPYQIQLPDQWLTPTKLIMFSDGEPASGGAYFAAVICFGFNNYRHLFMGEVTKNSVYGSGNLVSGQFSNHRRNNNNGADAAAWNDLTQALPFTANWIIGNGTARIGGVNVAAAGIAPAVKTFYAPRQFNNSPIDDFPTTAVLGGFGDEVNDGYVVRSRSPFAAAVTLVPINLFIGRGAGYIAPIGHVPGVRLVDMIDIEPEAVIEQADEFWKIVPLVSKQTDLIVTLPAQKFQAKHSSHTLGLAYRTVGG